MKVHLKRTGGVADIHKEWRLDSSRLHQDKAAKLKNFSDIAGLFSLPSERADSSLCRDTFWYELTVEEHEKIHTARFSEAFMTGVLRDCLRFIQSNIEEQKS